jgi:hypothetical protein
MKPRFRLRADGRLEVLTHDGYVPSVSSSLVSGSPRLASLHERLVVIVSPESLLPALQPALIDTQNHHLAGGHEACRPLSFEQNNHVPLSHGDTLASLTSPRG